MSAFIDNILLSIHCSCTVYTKKEKTWYGQIRKTVIRGEKSFNAIPILWDTDPD